MAVQQQEPYNEYTGNGITTTFIIGFDCDVQEHLMVTIDGLEAGYGSWNFNNSAVTFNIAPEVGVNIKLQRNTPVERMTEFQSYDNSFRPETINADLDKIIKILQEQGYTDATLINELAQEIYDRSLQNAELKGQIDNHTLSIFTITAIQQDEISKRIQGDQEVASAAREYTDLMLRMNNTSPSFFDGVTDNVVMTETGLSQRQINRITVKTLDTIDDLRTYKGNKNKNIVEVSSYHLDSITGGGTFYWDATSKELDNGGTIFKVINVETGRWKRQYTKLTFEDFGVVGNDRAVDDAIGIQKAINYLQTQVNGSISVGREGAIYYFKSPVIMTGTEVYVTEQNKMTVDFTGSKIIPIVSNIVCIVVNRNHVYLKNPHIQSNGSASNNIGILFGSLTPEIKGGTCFCKLENYTAEYLSVAFKAQPTLTKNGLNSGAYYNEIISPVFMHTDYGFQFTGNDLALDNQNTRYNIFNPRQVGGDFMFRLECCETLKVYGGSAEFIGNTTKNGSVIYIPKKYPNHLLDNQGIAFFGLVAEACNRLYENYSYDLGMFGISPINSAKPSIMGAGARINNEMIGRVQITSDTVDFDPILSITSKPLNKQIFMRIDNSGVPQIWADSTINITQHVELLNNILSAGTVRAKQELYSPKIVSPLGELILMSNNGANGGFLLSNNANSGMLWNSAEKDTVFGGSPAVRGSSDGAIKLGTATYRWGDIYATNSVIQTSDERYKEQFPSLVGAEKAAALEIKASICIYKFKDAIELKGTDARWHVGVKAQQIVQIMTNHGLDWKEYSFICHDSWEATEDQTITIEPETYDEEGNILTEAVIKTIKGIEAGDRYAVRYEELTMFILSSM